MINQHQIASSYPIYLPFTLSELLAERDGLQVTGADLDRIAEIDDIIADAEAGLVVLKRS